MRQKYYSELDILMGN